jgi:serine/threonine protein kinase
MINSLHSLKDIKPDKKGSCYLLRVLGQTLCGSVGLHWSQEEQRNVVLKISDRQLADKKISTKGICLMEDIPGEIEHFKYIEDHGGHPNIVSLIDSWVDSSYVAVFEYYPKGNLSKFLNGMHVDFFF